VFRRRTWHSVVLCDGFEDDDDDDDDEVSVRPLLQLEI